MKNNKNVLSDVDESQADNTLLAKLAKYQKLALVATFVLMPLLLINGVLQLFNRHMSKAVIIVLSSIIIAVACAVIVLQVIYLVCIIKSKKQEKQEQSQINSKEEN